MGDEVQKKSSFPRLRQWFQTRFSSDRLSSVANSESYTSPNSIGAFLAHQPNTASGASVSYQPRVSSYTSRQAKRRGQYFPRDQSVHTMLSVPELDSTSVLPPASTNPPVELQDTGRPRPRLFPINTPDDFWQFRSYEHHQPQLNSNLPPTVTKQHPLPRPKSFVVESNADLGAQSQSLPQFKAYTGKPIQDIPVQIQAYPGARKSTPGHYVPPSLQSGYAAGVPPTLRAACDSNSNLTQPLNDGASPTGKYAHPLVDFRHGLFINANMTDTNLAGQYQDPQIPTLNMPQRGLSDEVHAELHRRHQPPTEKEVVRPQSRAWMSPSSPVHKHTYELEASSSDIQVMKARAVNLRPQTPRLVTVCSAPKLKRDPPKYDAGTVKFNEYNWPRFADSEYVDPAQEHSRSFRQRARLLKKAKELAPA